MPVQRHQHGFEDYFSLRFGPKTNQEKSKRAEKLKKEKLEELGFLYRYRGTNEIERLKEPVIYLSQPSEFNDPYDMRIPNVIKLCKSLRKKIVQDLSDTLVLAGIVKEDMRHECQNKLNSTLRIRDWNKWITEICKIEKIYCPIPGDSAQNIINSLENKIREKHKQYIEKNQKQIGISCFSERYDSILMWSHYAESHSGICLGYSSECFTTRKVGAEHPMIDALHPINYQNDLSFCIEQHRKYFDDELIPDGDEEANLPFLIALTKAKEWEYEKEWRLIFRFSSDNPSEKDKKLPIIPSCIYLGAKINDTNKQIICKVAKQHRIAVKQMRLKENEFTLVAEDVDLSKFSG